MIDPRTPINHVTTGLHGYPRVDLISLSWGGWVFPSPITQSLFGQTLCADTKQRDLTVKPVPPQSGHKPCADKDSGLYLCHGVKNAFTASKALRTLSGLLTSMLIVFNLDEQDFFRLDSPDSVRQAANT